MKQGEQEQGKETMCEGQEDHGNMQTEISETGLGMRDETRGTRTNRGVLEM